MDYDFFDEKEKQETEGKEEKKTIQRVPAPFVSSEKGDFESPKKARKTPLWKSFLAVGLALLVFFTGYLVCWLSFDPELRTIAKLKEKIQDKYYKEVTDEEFYSAIFGGIDEEFSSSNSKRVTDEEFYSAIFGAINHNLLDPYSEYMTPSQYAAYTADLNGSRIGLGLVFNGDSLQIVRVCGNSPAEKAGVLTGEWVKGCGDSEEEITLCDDFDEFSALLEKYDEGREFCLKIDSEKGTRFVRVSREEYVENSVFYHTDETAYTLEGSAATTLTEKGSPMPYLGGDTAYIRLVQFTGNASAGFDVAMSKFKRDGKKNLVLDLRQNGGGLLDIMQSIAGYFCKNTTEKTPVVAVADFGERKDKYAAKRNAYEDYFSEDSRIYVLADNGSASASECLIGSMIDYGAIDFSDICLIERGGEARTYGKGIMQETYFVTLGEWDALKLTTAEIKWPISGRSIHGIGVRPSDGALTVQEDLNFAVETERAILKLLGN